ncbi:MAG: hypothetical protein U0P46_13745 [Holophagaceae bacterium]
MPLPLPAFARRLAPAALLLGLACQPPAAPKVYCPWEEGLTLTFEDPSRPQPERSANRLQVRVAKSAIAPGLPTLIQVDVASLRGQMPMTLKQQDGGVSLVTDQGQHLSVSLPAGFPATTAWKERGTEFRVLGRAAWDGAALLPATSDPVGIWVEARPLQGPRRRTLYLPNLGEVETQEERGGAWISVNRLVAYGFTSLPAIKRP